VGAATLGEAVGVPAAAVELGGTAEAVMEVPEVLTGPVVPVAEEAAELVEEAELAEEAAELAEELQAVNRTATHAREAQDATCRALRALPTWPPPAAGLAGLAAAAGVICMVFQSFNQRGVRLGEVRHIFDAERPGWVGKPLHRARTAAVRA
jgi:hypothetical protein